MSSKDNTVSMTDSEETLTVQEILDSTQAVSRGLEALRSEHEILLEELSAEKGRDHRSALTCSTYSEGFIKTGLQLAVLAC